MGNENTDDDAVRSQKETALEAVPAHEGGIGKEQQEERYIPRETFHRTFEFLQREIEVYETSDGKADEVDDEFVVVRILVDETYVKQDADDVESAEEPEGDLLLLFDVRKLYEDDVGPVRHENGQNDEDQEDEVPVLCPERRNFRHVFIDEIVKRKKKEHGGT